MGRSKAALVILIIGLVILILAELEDDPELAGRPLVDVTFHDP